MLRFVSRSFSPTKSQLFIVALLLTSLITVYRHANAEIQPAPSQDLRNPTTQTSSPDIAIVNGDQLNITVFDTPELSGPARVRNDGTVDFPLIGTVHVSGLTVSSAADLIRNRLIQGDFLKDPQVSISFADFANHSAIIFGEVNRPGPIVLSGVHTLWEVIGAAGGVTSAAGSRVTINHQDTASNPTILDLDWTKDLTGQPNPVIRPGDTLQVSRSGIVYVLGEVNQVGGYPIDHQKLTITEAVALARGVKYTSKASKAILVRSSSSGRSIIDIDIPKIIKGQLPDQVLQANDVIYVPNSVSKVVILKGLQAAVSVGSAILIYSNH